MVKIEVDPKFRGPILTDIEPTLHERAKDKPIKVGWRGTGEEVRLLESHADRSFIVCVSSLHEMGTAAFLLGAPIQMGITILTTGRDSLFVKKSYNWKEFSGEMGPSVTKSIVVRMAADAVRQGMKPRLAAVATDVLHGRVNPADADVLIRAWKG